MKIVAITVLVFILPACTRTIPWRFDTVDSAFPPERPLPHDAYHREIPLEFDVVWEAAKEFARQSKWKIVIVAEDKTSGVIRANAYETEDFVEFLQVNVREIGPGLSEVRAWSLRQESCKIFTFVHYAFKPIFWVATLGLFLWAEFAIGVTARELQRDRSCEERVMLHKGYVAINAPDQIFNRLLTAGALNPASQSR